MNSVRYALGSSLPYTIALIIYIEIGIEYVLGGCGLFSVSVSDEDAVFSISSDVAVRNQIPPAVAHEHSYRTVIHNDGANNHVALRTDIE